MDKNSILTLLLYISAFGISDNLFNYLNISTEKKLVLFTILFIITYKYLS